ncbi:hypothetical protein ACQPZX_12600 [Actinoplanes sp. CA-142083]|uniref:hypothetical protein n=1 Tax=Actinoplanes sp. CA-142083 TaxID=3239903 RepID=UPI003D8E59F7
MLRGAFECRALVEPVALAEAKGLQADAYVRSGHLPAAALTREGWLPWHDRAAAHRVRWFGTYDAGGRLVAVATKVSGGSLPTLRLMGDDRPAALDGCPSELIAEPSGVAKAPHVPLIATLHLYRAIYHDSVRRGDRLWVMSVIPAVRATLERVLPGAVTVGARPIRLAGAYPGVRAETVVYPAWGAVDGFTAQIRAAGNDEVADFMDDGIRV